MNLQILPLAITMMAGPQIMLSILLTTTKDVIKLSLAYIIAILTATTLGLIVTRTFFKLVGTQINFQSSGGQNGRILQFLFVGLLVYLSIKSYLNRSTTKPPKWMESIQNSTPKQIFKTGLMLILLMPTDIIVMLTVGLNLHTNNLSVLAALPFIVLTILIAAAPFLIYLLFRKKAEIIMPKVRDWMTNNAWVVNVAVYILFIYLLLAG